MADNRDSNDTEAATTSSHSSSKSTTNNSSRLGKCEVCAAHDARYACPKCEVKTCCVACVQIHKKELECDGIRDRTKFIPLREMTSMDFMSDYYFLEEATRYVQDRKDDKIKRITRYHSNLPTRQYLLRQATQKRDIKLQFLLQNFSRHKANGSYYSNKEKKIYWHVEWIFLNAGGLLYVDKRCAEDWPLTELLDKYLNPDCVESVPEKKELEYYQSVGVYNLKVLLKAEGIKRSGLRYYQLDVGKSLKENLKGKTLVEYPSIYLSYECDVAAFDIIDSDEDVEAETKKYQAALETDFKAKLAAKRFATYKEHTGESTPIVEDAQKLKERRKRKCEEYEANTNNFLFTDDKLLAMLSSSEDEESCEKGSSKTDKLMN